MPVYQGNDLKKITGGKKRAYRKPRRREIGSFPTDTIVSEMEERVVSRTYGGNSKIRVRKALYANVQIPGGESKKAKILRVVEAPMNPDYVRRGIIVKGVVIETELGRAVVTSRPGQDGVVNAVLIK
ncbi:SSU ribosomal protein S8E [Desulfurococcaceae archaeon AG1]|jgi:small subunit ribosomal protein S8e|nr:MAG: 30S ribosomal protein S8e [Desulfurococcaceae archaeon]GAY25251.1 SSU ribosomal protein S8E [Desulfurococcaceae archaeon AG1]